MPLGSMPLVYASGMALGLCLYACVVRDAGHAVNGIVVVASATESMVFTTAAAVLAMNTTEDITTVMMMMMLMMLMMMLLLSLMLSLNAVAVIDVVAHDDSCIGFIALLLNCYMLS